MADSDEKLLTPAEAVAKAAAEMGFNKKSEEQDSEEENAEESSESGKGDKEETSDKDSSKDKKEESKEEESEDNSDAEAEEIQQGLEILRALRDPKTSGNLIRDLALRAGILESSKDTLSKTEEKELKDIIAEELGEEYPDLKDKFTKILNAVEAKNTKTIKTLEDKLALEQAKNAEKNFTEEFTGFIKSNNITEKEAQLMLKEISELPPSKDISLTKYLTKIYRITSSEKKAADTTLEQNRRRTENQKEKVKNLSSGADDIKRIKLGGRLPSAKESVQAALRGEIFED